MTNDQDQSATHATTPCLNQLSNGMLRSVRYRSYALIVLAALWMTIGLVMAAAVALSAINNQPMQAIFPLFSIALILSSLGLLIRTRGFQWLAILISIGMMARPPYGLVFGMIALWLIITSGSLFGHARFSHQAIQTEHLRRQTHHHAK